MSTFTVTLRSKPGDDGIKTLRYALKILWRRFGLKAVQIEEQKPRRVRRSKSRLLKCA